MSRLTCGTFGTSDSLTPRVDLSRAHPCTKAYLDPPQPLDRESIVREYRRFVTKHGLCPATTVILSGAALVMHGLRDLAHDLDLQTTEAVIEKFKGQGYTVHYTSPKGKLRAGWTMVKDGETLFDLGPGSYEYELIDGIPVQTLQELLELKLVFQRPKDIDDIRNILDEMLKRTAAAV